MIRLVLPNSRWGGSYREALREALTTSSHPEIIESQIAHLHERLAYLRALSSGSVRGVVPQVTYWLVDEDRYIGEICIRLKRSGRHPKIRSNLYYYVRPSARGLGYGTRLFALGLRKAMLLGLDRLRVAVAANNLASLVIVERFGGKLVRRMRLPGEEVDTNLYEVDSRRRNPAGRMRHQTRQSRNT